jgi:hypothetical protein
MLIIGLIGTGTAAADQATPFKATIDAVTTPLAPTPDCPIFLQSDQSGEATHLGRYVGTGTTCGFNFRVVEEPPFNPGGEPPYFVADFINEETLTAANGDQLFVTSHGVRVESLPDGTSGNRGEATIHGGTGRFEGATGQAFGGRDADEEVNRIEGWIHYHASNASS